MRLIPLALFAAALSACAPDQPRNESAASDATANVAVPVATQTAAPALTLIPARFIGIFDVDAAACAEPTSDRRFSIEPAQIRFLEGNAKVRSVTALADQSVSVDATLPVEASPGPHLYTLALAAGGKLTLTDAGASSNYVRCDSQPGAATKPLLNLAGDGLSFVDPRSGSAHMLTFGMPRAEVVRAVTATRGASSGQGSNTDCGEGPLAYVNFPGSLGLFFQEGKFAGWSVGHGGDRKLATASGLALGTTRRDLASAYDASVSDSSLGTEFAAGGLSGLLDGKGPTARVTDMWAGMTCIAR